MARIFCIPGAALIFGAFVLNLIVSISLPYLPPLDISRTHFDELAFEDGQNAMTELRFGIWTPCYYNQDDDRTCSKIGYAYNVTVTNRGESNQVTITAPWTRGLAVHPVAAIASLLASALALSEHVTVALVATLTAWLASLLTLVAFLIDIALFAWTRHQFKRLDVGARTITGPGFWITFAAFIILFIGGLSTCLGRIKDRRASRHVKDLAAVEAARAKEAEAAAHNHADEKSEKVEDDAAQPGSTPGWARKFKFGKKSQA